MEVFLGIVGFFLVAVAVSAAATVYRVSRVPKESWVDIIEASNSVKDDKLRQLIVQRAVGLTVAAEDDGIFLL